MVHCLSAPNNVLDYNLVVNYYGLLDDLTCAGQTHGAHWGAERSHARIHTERTDIGENVVTHRAFFKPHLRDCDVEVDVQVAQKYKRRLEDKGWQEISAFCRLVMSGVRFVLGSHHTAVALLCKLN